jgi:hypothetical protein
MLYMSPARLTHQVTCMHHHGGGDGARSTRAMLVACFWARLQQPPVSLPSFRLEVITPSLVNMATIVSLLDIDA